MWDVLVIGGGHAGVEAACASARRGANTALLSMAQDDLGQMSCNPSIGGVGKGHLVREIDALGGVMAKAADRAAIHRRMLNASKGSAVRGPRIQADRKLFRRAVGELVKQSAVHFVAGEAGAILVECGAISGIVLADGSIVRAKAVVLATGTFLGATLFRGTERWEGGRARATSASRLAKQLGDLGLANGRLKTGTPPRLDGRTIDWAKLQPQPSDARAWNLSIEREADRLPKLACAITRSNARTHDIIRSGLDRSPLYAGAIEGRGPRYCPSIEDKIVRFGDRDGHQIFLEPEGLDDTAVYPNGISTSLPTDVQIDFLRSIEGLERVDVQQPGYAVEYGYADPRRLRSSLEHRELPGLFLAGQINGTTGYEEAGAQGLVAGANAAARALDIEEFIPNRESSYIGVMLDDLTLQGVSEPYRMLTARAEYRLYLRADNAVARLSHLAEKLDLLDEKRQAAVRAHLEDRDTKAARLRHPIAGEEIGASSDEVRPAAEWVKRADIAPAVIEWLGKTPGAEEAVDDVLYAPYVERAKREVSSRKRDRELRLPDGFDFERVPGLSLEMRERLRASSPENLDQASRVIGVTPAALSALHLALVRQATC